MRMALRNQSPILLDRPGVLEQPNAFTECLYRDGALWGEIIARGGIEAVCCPAMSNAGVTPPWIAMPPEGRRFQQIGSIPTGVVENTDLLVLTFDVPLGYDGVIVSIVQMFTAAGFAEGSGDLNWRIRINRRWLKDFGNTTTTLGTVAAPCMIYRGGIRLRTKQVVSYFVNLGTGATGRLDPNGRIICACFGWFYPI
jgi:hypothetical protein